MSAFRRWRGRHEDAGLEGLYDRRIGRASAQRVAVDRSRPTQVGRALAQLGIEHIAAYSPAARGRSERMFATLQDRLPKELALTGIETVEAANRFIAEHYLPRHNARFAVTPAEPGSAFAPDAGRAARDILCIQHERQVGNDNTVHVLRRPVNLISYRQSVAKRVYVVSGER